MIHQLRRLGKVWQDVLPVNIYCKAMGTLLNTTICELINKIMMLEVSQDHSVQFYHFGSILCEVKSV